MLEHQLLAEHGATHDEISKVERHNLTINRITFQQSLWTDFTAQRREPDDPTFRYGDAGRSEDKLRHVADFVRTAVMEKLARMRWQQNLEDLRREIREAGGLKLRGSKEKVIERLRETRREIFETEYAHLYR